MISLNAEEHSEEEPEAGDVVIEDLGALLLLEQVGGEQPELHDHPCQPGRDFTLQETETALKKKESVKERRIKCITFASEAFPWSSRCFMEMGAGEYLPSRVHCTPCFLSFAFNEKQLNANVTSNLYLLAIFVQLVEGVSVK